jgi:membrane-bound metal-dependent hydrolase YbcI (DUF457 family)
VYVGHVGAALGGKRLAPAAAMGALVFAAYLPDWVDAALCVTGRYHDAQMYSHSIPAALVLAFLAAATQFRRADPRAALVIAAVVVSHILLDYLTGIKPTWPGGPVIGLQIYRYPALDLVTETSVIVAGWMFYRRTLPASNGKWNGSHLMLGILLLMQLGADAGRLLLPSVNKC